MNRFREWVCSGCFLLGVLFLVLPRSAMAADPALPSSDELVKESVKLIRQLDEDSKIRMLIQLASLEGRLGAKDVAHSLFLEVTRTLSQANHSEWFLEDLVLAEREVGDQTALDETLPAALSIIGRTTKEKSTNGIEAAKAEYFRLDRLLDKAGIYASAGKSDRAKELVHAVVQALPSLNWSDQGLLRQSLARCQGQIGDEKGTLATLHENSGYFKRVSVEIDPEKVNPLLPFRSEVGVFASVAQAQHCAGHFVAARATINEAYKKAELIPVGSNGDEGPRSAAFKSVVMVAAEIGEAQLALAAQRRITDEAYQGALGLVIIALAKQGDGIIAEQLARSHKCCGFHLAVGLSEHGEWESAVRAEENPDYRCDCCDCRWDVEGPERGLRVVSKALVHARGVRKALVRVEESKSTEFKVKVLLGILESMHEQDENKVNREK